MSQSIILTSKFSQEDFSLEEQGSVIRFLVAGGIIPSDIP